MLSHSEEQCSFLSWLWHMQIENLTAELPGVGHTHESTFSLATESSCSVGSTEKEHSDFIAALVSGSVLIRANQAWMLTFVWDSHLCWAVVPGKLQLEKPWNFLFSSCLFNSAQHLPYLQSLKELCLLGKLYTKMVVLNPKEWHMVERRVV